MESHLSKVKGLSLLALSLTGLIACGAGGDSGRLSMSLTDKPTDDYQAVYVTIKEVAIHAAGDPEGTYDRPRSEPDLQPHGPRQRREEQLGIVSLDPGSYTQLRLIIGTEADNGTNILGDPHSCRQSCHRSGRQLRHHEDPERHPDRDQARPGIRDQ